MKKLLSLIVILALMLAGCGAREPQGVKTDFTVAIVQQLDHSSLDEIRQAIETRLEELAAPTNYTLTVETFNGQNDASTLNQIGSQVVSEGYDLLIPIGTLAAQALVTAAEDTRTPVVYAAVSDPESVGLTGFDYVTGTSDALNTEFILDMMCAADPEIRTVGLLYSNSEPNSETPIAQAKAYLENLGIACLSATGNTADEILTAAASLVGHVDGVFTPTDNVVMASEAAVAEIFREAGIPHYTGADSFVTAGAFATCGVNYTDLGIKTADMAFHILLGGEVGDFQTMAGGIVTVNSETAAAVGLDPSVFARMEEVSVLETVTTGD